jgi:hypothetical protein
MCKDDRVSCNYLCVLWFGVGVCWYYECTAAGGRGIGYVVGKQDGVGARGVGGKRGMVVSVLGLVGMG